MRLPLPQEPAHMYSSQRQRLSAAEGSGRCQYKGFEGMSTSKGSQAGITVNPSHFTPAPSCDEKKKDLSVATQRYSTSNLQSSFRYGRVLGFENIGVEDDTGSQERCMRTAMMSGYGRLARCGVSFGVGALIRRWWTLVTVRKLDGDALVQPKNGRKGQDLASPRYGRLIPSPSMAGTEFRAISCATCAFTPRIHWVGTQPYRKGCSGARYKQITRRKSDHSPLHPIAHGMERETAHQESAEHDERPPSLVGESFRSALPKPGAEDVDLWKTLLDKEKKYDKNRCDVWKEEIDNVLIFAALFSAIVTAFTLDASKRLEVDQQESTATLLFLVHQQLDSIARQNTTTLPDLIANPASTFQIPPYAVHINVCWYLSLTLSLMTAVLGILCLQWLREHRRDTSAPAEDVFFLRFHRIRAMDHWKVSALIGSLPVLLLASLFLFLSGLAVYLWTINRSVAIAASIAIGSTISILLITSTLPVMKRGCVFRSPQVWPFRYLWGAIFRQLASDRAPTGDWLDEDRKVVESIRNTVGPWRWLTQTFVQDQEVMLAFLHWVEAKGDVDGALTQYMHSQLWDERPASVHVGETAILGDTALEKDVRLAICIAYVWKICPPLREQLLSRRMESHLRMMSWDMVQVSGNDRPKALKSGLENAIKEVVTIFCDDMQRLRAADVTLYMPERLLRQIEGTVWRIMTRRRVRSWEPSAFLKTMIYSLPEPHVGSFKVNVNQLNAKLRSALQSTTPHDTLDRQVLIANCADYIHSWCYMKWTHLFGRPVSLPRNAIMSLAQALDTEMTNHNLRDQKRYSEETSEWTWSGFTQAIDIAQPPQDALAAEATAQQTQVVPPPPLRPTRTALPVN
ncbi:hypothetical protein NMY22_g3802 [Coprinellus aureogranulatus]|nr:hypothetical protein NMY22_g3802 [Coprinellus aureogranulatus]